MQLPSIAKSIIAKAWERKIWYIYGLPNSIEGYLQEWYSEHIETAYYPLDCTEAFSAAANLVVNALHDRHFAWPLRPCNHLLHYSRRPVRQARWYPMQANLFLISLSCMPLSNAKKQHELNDFQSNTSNSNLGISIHHSHFLAVTSQFQY